MELPRHRLERLTGMLSTLLSVVRSNCRRLVHLRSKPGAEGRDRTADTGFFRPVLYQLSYLGQGLVALVCPPAHCLTALEADPSRPTKGSKTGSFREEPHWRRRSGGGRSHTEGSVPESPERALRVPLQLPGWDTAKRLGGEQGPSPEVA